MATRPIDIDAQVIGVNLNIRFFGLWQDGNRYGTGVDAALAFGGRYPLYAVYARLKLELTVGVDATQGKADIFKAANFVRALTNELSFKAVVFGPAVVHAVQLTGK